MNERGSAALELAIGMAVLVVPAVMVVASFSVWLEARAFVRAAAAEAGRAAVLSDGDAAAAGDAVAREMAAGRGFAGDSVAVSMCSGGPCLLARGGVVTATVSVEVPLVQTPWGEVGGVAVTYTHAEPVDAFRSLP